MATTVDRESAKAPASAHALVFVLSVDHGNSRNVLSVHSTFAGVEAAAWSVVRDRWSAEMPAMPDDLRDAIRELDEHCVCWISIDHFEVCD